MYILSYEGGVEEYGSLAEAVEAFPSDKWAFDGIDTWVSEFVDAIIVVYVDEEPVLH